MRAFAYIGLSAKIGHHESLVGPVFHCAKSPEEIHDFLTLCAFQDTASDLTVRPFQRRCLVVKHRPIDKLAIGRRPDKMNLDHSMSIVPGDKLKYVPQLL